MGDGFLIFLVLMGFIGSIYNKNLVKNNDVFVIIGY